MKASDISALRELLSRATPGPWTIELYGDVGSDNLVIHSDADNRVCFMATPGAHSDRIAIAANARLIVEATAALPSLLDEVEALRKALRKVQPILAMTRLASTMGERHLQIEAEVAAALGRSAP